MENEVIAYVQMCQREGVSLQRGMNYRLRPDYSVILMSVRPNAPYRDRIEEDGSVLVYEGHDIPRAVDHPNPKLEDQLALTAMGSLTQNGHFNKAARDYKKGIRPPEQVKVYEKIYSGIWSYNGLFHLVDSWLENDGKRKVFKFKLVAVADPGEPLTPYAHPADRRRIIPTAVKLAVWARDGGKCVMCGAGDELHFDHIIPFSKGGTSVTADNVQLLCARHNISKRDKIE